MKYLYKNLFLVAGFLLSGLTLAAQGTMRVDGATAQIVCSGSPFVVLNNMHFANNASSAMLTAGTSEFDFIGNLNVNISSTGSFTTQFYNTLFNKTGGSELVVTTNNMTLITSNTMTMTSGNVNMNNNLLSTWQLGTSTVNLGTLSRVSGHFYNGFFRRWYSTASFGAPVDVAQWDIPVGMSAASYNYARVIYPAALTSGGTIRTMFVPVVPFYNGLALTDATNFAACGAPVTLNNAANEGYWHMQVANGLDMVSPYQIKLDWNNFTTVTAPNCLRIIKSEDLATWMQEGTHGSVNVPGTWVTRDGQTGFPGALNGSLFTLAGDILVNPLPVELTSLTANCTSNSMVVNWTTASESGNDYFVLERSKDLLTWDIVATVPTLNGNSNVAQQYSFEDHSFGGVFYYRLNQVDINGTVKTYPPITITCNGAGEPSIVNLYQNGDGQVTIVLFAPGELDYSLGLYDILGQKISASQGMLTGGNNTITLDASALRDAYYLVNVQLGDKSLSRKIFVK